MYCGACIRRALNNSRPSTGTVVVVGSSKPKTMIVMIIAKIPSVMDSKRFIVNKGDFL